MKTKTTKVAKTTKTARVAKATSRRPKTMTFILTDDRLASEHMLAGESLTFTMTRDVAVGDIILVRDMRTDNDYVGVARRLAPVVRIETDLGVSEFSSGNGEVLGKLSEWDAFPDLDYIEVD